MGGYGLQMEVSELNHQSQHVDVWGELIRTRDAVPTMLWPAITEETLREVERNFTGPMCVDADQESSLGMKEARPTGCSIVRVEVKEDDRGFYLAGLLHAPAHMVETPMHWSMEQGGERGAKLLALYFVPASPKPLKLVSASPARIPPDSH
jgi:hypothetical protein